MNEEEKPKRTLRSEIALLASIITVFAFFTGITTILPPEPSYTPEPAKPADYNTLSSTPEITPEPNYIIQQPKDLTVYPLDTARFTVVASKAVKSYMWQYLKPGASWKNVTVTIFPSATTDTFTFTAHDSHNGFQYRCIVHFEDGTTEVSEPAKITVKSY